MPRSTAASSGAALADQRSRGARAAARGDRRRHHLARVCRVRSPPITRVTEMVAAGQVPAFRSRIAAARDEIGALAARSAVFQACHAAQRGAQQDRERRRAGARPQRQEEIAAEIGRFSAPTSSRLWPSWLQSGDQMLQASAAVSAECRRPCLRPDRGRDHGLDRGVRQCARHRLRRRRAGASVLEIDRQVAQSNAIATKAVGEAERTNATVTGAERGRQPDRRRDSHDQRHRRADQSARAQRHDRGRARRRGRARLRGGRRRGEGSGRADRQGDRGDLRRRSPACSRRRSARSAPSARSSAPSARSAISAARSRRR